MTKTFNKETNRYEWDKPSQAKPAQPTAEVQALTAQVAQLSAQVLVLTTAFESLAEAKTIKEIRALAELVKM